MKFLCRECDTAIKFKDVMRPEQGSVTAVFECPDCFMEFAMFLNPWETQMLKSLDLQLGGSAEAAQPMQMVRSQLGTAKRESMPATPAAQDANASGTAEGGKCPFTSVIAGAFEEEEPTKAEPAGPTWSAEALSRLERIPSFVRPMAKMGIETFARDNGYAEITAEVMDAARGSFPSQF